MQHLPRSCVHARRARLRRPAVATITATTALAAALAAAWCISPFVSALAPILPADAARLPAEVGR